VVPLDASYEYCRRLARSRAKNFYYSFLLLPREQRDAICAVYAFMRHCDDLSDEPAGGDAAAARTALESWRRDLHRALAGDIPAHPAWPALADAVRRFGLPGRHLDEMIDGVSSDLEPRRLVHFDELYRYCYQVASVVGLTVVRIFGYRSEEALPLAEKCGIAFQLTNILRDIREDAERSRVYLPAEDLERFGVDPAGFTVSRPGPNFVELMRFEAARARAYYRESRPLIGLVHPRSRPSLWALIEIYRRLLERIEASGYDVLGRRIRVPPWEKLSIILRAPAVSRKGWNHEAGDSQVV
jgi:phytoene synthase